jgi:hypothetical protein
MPGARPTTARPPPLLGVHHRPSWPLSGMDVTWPPRTNQASPPPRESLTPHERTRPSAMIASELRLPATCATWPFLEGLSTPVATLCAGPVPPLGPRQPRATSPPPQVYTHPSVRGIWACAGNFFGPCCEHQPCFPFEGVPHSWSHTHCVRPPPPAPCVPGAPSLAPCELCSVDFSPL